jgi:hypothetical protein
MSNFMKGVYILSLLNDISYLIEVDILFASKFLEMDSSNSHILLISCCTFWSWITNPQSHSPTSLMYKEHSNTDNIYSDALD